MAKKLSATAQRIEDALNSMGLQNRVKELEETTRTAQEAALAVGCQIGQIVKSLLFKGKRSQKVFLFLVSGQNRVDVDKLNLTLGDELEKCDAQFVRDHTGFSIGGVPPLGHKKESEVFIDEDLLRYTQIWAAAGTPNAVFSLSPAELFRITQGKPIQVK